MSRIEKLTAGIDWISATMRKEHDNATEWHTNALKSLETIAKTGNSIGARRLLGFEGLSAGNCFVGENETTYYAQFTGAYANDAYPVVIQEKAHISRIDVQITVQFEEYVSNIARRAYADANLANNSLPTHRRRKLTLITGSDGGDTCYIGSPSSEQRGRIYNKERQSDDPKYQRSWRYECVFKNDVATSFAISLLNTDTNHPSFCLGTVVSWFDARGVDCSGYYSGRAIVTRIERTLPTDVERKLQWLQEQVAPTVRYLNSLGFRGTLMEVLFPTEGES